MAGGTEYIVSLNMELKTASGVGWSGAERLVWTFTTSRPSVVSLEPTVMELLPLDPEIKLTFNQPMDTASVESNFSFRGTEGTLPGKFSWNEEETTLAFVPEDLLRSKMVNERGPEAAGLWPRIFPAIADKDLPHASRVRACLR